MTKLNEIEVRVLGSLVEKEITTPDYYPLSLNALINACNQKSNRDPVMALDERVVTQALDSLNEKGLAGQVTSADSRVPKYAHRLQEVFNFDRREMAVLCVLLLRGPQTPGRITRTRRKDVPIRRPRRGGVRASSSDGKRTSPGEKVGAPAGHEGVALRALAGRRCGRVDRAGRGTPRGCDRRSR